MKKEVEVPCDSYINILSWLDPKNKQVLAGGENGYLILVQFWINLSCIFFFNAKEYWNKAEKCCEAIGLYCNPEVSFHLLSLSKIVE